VGQVVIDQPLAAVVDQDRAKDVIISGGENISSIEVEQVP
jgi:acyl-CoA synthetase (AMP-forming)/AMP-acid ligase II